MGLHTRNHGSLEKTAQKAYELGANTLQIFSSSPRMWRPSKPDPDDVRRMLRVRERHDLRPLAIHCNYLINLASADDELRAQSVKAFRGELERAIRLEADFLVAHPGSYRGESLEDGLVQFVRGVARATEGLRFGNLMLLIEGTAGSGTAIGARFEELHALREATACFTEVPVGFCLDTCHLFASGHDIATRAGLLATLRSAGELLGFEHLKLIHANDSKTPLGSHVDRHENIGAGHIGREGFQRILTHPRLRKLPFILETPMESDDDARRDIETLKTLCQRSRTTITRSS